MLRSVLTNVRFVRYLIAAGVALSLALVSPIGASGSAANATPQLKIVPNPVPRGEPTTAFGSGFCSKKACSKVTIELDGNTVASGPVGSDGKFALKFRPMVISGQYPVTAHQTTPDGKREATTGLTVLVADKPSATQQTPPKTTTRTPPPTAPSTTQRPDKPLTTALPPNGVQDTATRTSSTTSASTSPTTDATATPLSSEADESRNGGSSWLWWLIPGFLLPAVAVTLWLARRNRDTGTSP